MSLDYLNNQTSFLYPVLLVWERGLILLLHKLYLLHTPGNNHLVRHHIHEGRHSHDANIKN